MGAGSRHRVVRWSASFNFVSRELAHAQQKGESMKKVIIATWPCMVTTTTFILYDRQLRRLLQTTPRKGGFKSVEWDGKRLQIVFEKFSSKRLAIL